MRASGVPGAVWPVVRRHSGLATAAAWKVECVVSARLPLLIADTALGALLVWGLAEWGWEGRVGWGLEGVIGRLEELLRWLMGHPAGLKLNEPLNRALGGFFLYHIYLWRTYMSFLGPWLRHAVQAARLGGGCLGVSGLAGLSSDVVSLLGLHVYCFHVYATRLYQLQMTGLVAMARLFRGKKYNPLRERIDSAVLDAEELFVGTLLFTVLLFLLPTTGVYYAVFGALRLCVVLVQAVLSRLCRPSLGRAESSEEGRGKELETSAWDLVSGVLMGTIV